MGKWPTGPRDEEKLSMLKAHRQAEFKILYKGSQESSLLLCLIFQDTGERLVRTRQRVSSLTSESSRCHSRSQGRGPYNPSQGFSAMLLCKLCLTNLQKLVIHPDPTPTLSPVTAGPLWNPVEDGSWFSTKITHQLFYLFDADISECCNSRFPRISSHGRQLEDKQVEWETSSWLFLACREGFPQVTNKPMAQE